MQQYLKSRVAEIKELMNFLNIFLNCKSQHVIKCAIPEIEKKQNKLTYESNPSEKCEQNITNKIKQKKYFTLKTQILIINKSFHKH